jgi:hypothetical protein
VVVARLGEVVVGGYYDLLRTPLGTRPGTALTPREREPRRLANQAEATVSTARTSSHQEQLDSILVDAINKLLENIIQDDCADRALPIENFGSLCVPDQNVNGTKGPVNGIEKESIFDSSEPEIDFAALFPRLSGDNPAGNDDAVPTLSHVLGVSSLTFRACHQQSSPRCQVTAVRGLAAPPTAAGYAGRPRSK